MTVYPKLEATCHKLSVWNLIK